MGNLMYRALLSKPNETVRFYCSSGGNAGLGCATAAIALKMPCTIVVPQKTSKHMVDKLVILGAEVHQIGDNWCAADTHLRENLLANDPTGVYVPPFDHPHVWEGASTIVRELEQQMPDTQQPFAIVCNCGGGGLVNGIMQGVEEATKLWKGGEEKAQVLAVETQGADSLDASVRAGELVTLPAIASIASSLGALTVSRQTFEWSRKGNFHNVVVTDADAVMGSLRFADDARILVEVACGATLSVVYNGKLRGMLGEGMNDEEWGQKNVVVIVCGGSHVSLDMLREYREKYGGS